MKLPSALRTARARRNAYIRWHGHTSAADKFTFLEATVWERVVQEAEEGHTALAMAAMDRLIQIIRLRGELEILAGRPGGAGVGT
jgi:hypothetical protein